MSISSMEQLDRQMRTAARRQEPLVSFDMILHSNVHVDEPARNEPDIHFCHRLKELRASEICKAF